METKFEIGDVVRCINNATHESYGVKLLTPGAEYCVAGFLGGDPQEVRLEGVDWYWVADRFELVRRASAQREGGFAVGHRVRAKETAAIHKGRVGVITMHVIDKHWAVLFDGDPATDACSSMGEHELEPADPAPMTRAAMVLAKMEEDPYLKQPEVRDMVRIKANLRNEKARERMAAMTVDLDRELTHDPKRWAQLYGPVHPVTSRAVRGRR